MPMESLLYLAPGQVLECEWFDHDAAYFQPWGTCPPRKYEGLTTDSQSSGLEGQDVYYVGK
jgi:hypothetical protein